MTSINKKLEKLQEKLDSYYPDYPPKSLVQEYYFLLDLKNSIEKYSVENIKAMNKG